MDRELLKELMDKVFASKDVNGSAKYLYLYLAFRSKRWIAKVPQSEMERVLDLKTRATSDVIARLIKAGWIARPRPKKLLWDGDCVPTILLFR